MDNPEGLILVILIIAAAVFFLWLGWKLRLAWKNFLFSKRIRRGKRGEGDAISASNYAEAYSQDVDFYSFYRSLESYKKSFSDQGDILVLNPESEFFRYFNPSK